MRAEAAIEAASATCPSRGSVVWSARSAHFVKQIESLARTSYRRSLIRASISLFTNGVSLVAMSDRVDRRASQRCALGADRCRPRSSKYGHVFLTVRRTFANFHSKAAIVGLLSATRGYSRYGEADTQRSTCGTAGSCPIDGWTRQQALAGVTRRSLVSTSC